jgi:hypothetical protein
MNMVKKSFILILGLSFLMSGAVMAAGGGKGKNATPAPELTAEEIADLVHLREEEKLARDVYNELYAEWGQWIFDNIAQSEQQHMDAVKNLLEKYGIEDPVDPDEPGVLKNEDLQSLYDSLVSYGNGSKEQALHVGATIEDMDIYDIQAMLENTDNPDLEDVYQNLMKGSRNHLRSFTTLLLDLFDVTYEAQYLPQDELDDIITSPKETGRY